MSFAHDRRIMVYPAYLNKKRTIPEGRKIPVEKACEDPALNEILDACKFMKLEAEIEAYKSYSREWWNRGRVRVELFNEDGGLANPQFPTRMSVYLRVAELVPKHPGRKEKLQQQQTQSGGQSKHDGKKKGKKGGKKR